MKPSVAKESFGERRRTRREGRVGTMLCKELGSSEVAVTGD